MVLIIGPFFGNHLRPVDNVLGRAHMLSTMRYHTSVVIYLFAALGTLGSSSRKLMRLSAYADRITDMQNTVKGLASNAGGRPQLTARSSAVLAALRPTARTEIAWILLLGQEQLVDSCFSFFQAAHALWLCIQAVFLPAVHTGMSSLRLAVHCKLPPYLTYSPGLTMKQFRLTLPLPLPPYIHACVLSACACKPSRSSSPCIHP